MRDVVADLSTCRSSFFMRRQSCHASVDASSVLTSGVVLLELVGNLTAAYAPSTLSTRPIGTERTSSTKITSLLMRNFEKDFNEI